MKRHKAIASRNSDIGTQTAMAYSNNEIAVQFRDDSKWQNDLLREAIAIVKLDLADARENPDTEPAYIERLEAWLAKAEADE